MNHAPHPDHPRTCTSCGQRVQTYRRSISSTMARWLIELVRLHDREPRPYVASERWSLAIMKGTGDVAKLRYWGLVEPAKSVRGGWIPTAAGRVFARGDSTAAEFALVFNGEFLRHEGREITIRECLGKHFDLQQLLNGG